MDNQEHPLSILSRAPAAALKEVAEHVLATLSPADDLAVLVNRTGLVMVPYRDSAKGTLFHLGEVLMSESQVRLTISGGEPIEGYGMCVGRDLEQSMGMAVLDAALRANVARAMITAFISAQQQAQQADDEALLQQVAATRVEMETF